jgi:Rrf2 family protein
MISTKSRYGLRALLYITLKGEKSKTAIKEIAEKEGISGRYLEQIFSVLKQGNIVKSVKGAGGGYVLSKPSNKISIKEIVELLEKDCYCEIDTEEQSSGSLEHTLNEYLWKEYNKVLQEFFESLTLESLAVQHKENQVFMYYI